MQTPLRILCTLPILALLGAGWVTARAGERLPERAVSFHKQIKPILQKRCQGCHQPLSQGGKLILTTFAAFQAGGAAGPSFKPGRPEESLVLRFIAGNPPAMPKNAKPLSTEEVELFRRWIAEGAKDDSPVVKDPIDAAHPPVYQAPPVLSALAYSPDGKTLAVSGYREILLHKSDGSERIARLVGRSPRIESLAYSPDGKMLAAVGGAPSRFGEAQFWNTANNTLLNAVELSYDELFGASFSPDGKQLGMAGADNAVRIISVPDGKLLLKFDNHSDWTFATTWTLGVENGTGNQGLTNRPPTHEDTQYILSTGRDRAIKLIIAKNGSFVDDINTFTSPYRCMARHPKANQVLVAGDDGIPRLYQIFRTKARTMNQEDHNLVRAYEKQPGQVNVVAFSADGSRFAVGGEGREARLYNTDDGKLIATLRGMAGTTYALAFRPDSQEVAVGGFDGQVRLFNTTTGALVKAFVPVPLVTKTAAKP